jgi:uncharacterized damage-inducible protein DinB
MPNTLQEFLATATQKAAADLEKAVLNIPEDKRNWSPQRDARTALDQAAEVAMLNGATAKLIKTRKWGTDFDFSEYESKKAELAKDWNAVKALLDENTPKAVAAIKATPDEDLGIEVMMPWGPMTLAQIISYPYWNMSYHEGQINYIASMLGCLDYSPS